MSDLDDLDLDRGTGRWTSPGPGLRRPSGPDWRIIGGAAAVVVVGAIVYVFWGRPSAPTPGPAPVATEATEQEVAPLPPPAEAPIELPPLGESDVLVRELVRALSARPELVVWLATDQLIRNFVVVVDNIAEGVAPLRHLRKLTPAEPFRVVERREASYVDPRSYARYDGVADAFASLDLAGTAHSYRQLKPLLDEAYRELGHPQGNFDIAMERAIGRLLAVPVPEGDQRVTLHILTYRYADPALEALSPAQKLLLRMGPRNVRSIQARLRELADALALTPRDPGTR